MRGVLLRAVLASAALLGGAVTVVLVGSDDGPGPEVVAETVDAARRAPTARAVFSFTLDAPPGFEDRAVSFGGSADFDFAAGRSHAVVQYSAALGGDGPTGTVPAQTQMDLVTDAGALYVRTDDRWFSVDVDELARVTGRPSLALGAGDPTHTLEYLRGATGDVEEVGPEPVRDVDTTHYRVEVDLERAAEAAPGERREAMADAVTQFRTQFGTARLPVDVWVDGDGLPRRFRFELDLGEHDSTGEVPEGAIMSFTMELFDYGAPVRVDVPPADAVADLGAVPEGA